MIRMPPAFLPPHSRLFAHEIGEACLPTNAAGSAPHVMITPTGARVSRIYICGALTEIRRPSAGGGYVRVADPTGVLVLFIRARDREVQQTLSSFSPPEFVSCTATPDPDSTISPGGFRLMLDGITRSDRLIRDQWIIMTACQTTTRLVRISQILEGESTDPDEIEAVALHSLTPEKLQNIAGIVEKALSQVQTLDLGPAGEKRCDELGLTPDAAGIIMDLIRTHSGPRGVSVEELTIIAKNSGIDGPRLMESLRSLIAEDELYQPSSGFVKIL